MSELEKLLEEGRSRALEARNTHVNRKRAERNAAQAEAASRAIKEQQRKGGRPGVAAGTAEGADSPSEGAAPASTGSASPASSTRSAAATSTSSPSIKQEAMDDSPSFADSSRSSPRQSQRPRHGTAIAFQQPAAPAPQSMH